MNPKRLSYEDFRKIYNIVPRLCVDLIIKTKDGIVFSKRDIEPQKGYWHFPGGTVLFGETIQEAITRIGKEETGLKLKTIKIVGIIEFKPSSPHRHTISIAHMVEPISGVLRGSRQGKEIQFFKAIPSKTIKEQKDFLLKSNLLKK
jgi:ADP-ribose pyrophosphatase YjhB (NUDIX family)